MSSLTPLDSLPETVVISGPDTAYGGLPVTLTYCATGLVSNSVSQWNTTNFSGFGPNPPWNNPGSCQNILYYLMPGWVPVMNTVTCTNYGSTATHTTWIIPPQSDQTFTGITAPFQGCETQFIQTASSLSWYRITPSNVVLLPHRWQYRDSVTGTWTDLVSHPGNIPGFPYSALPTNPAQRVTTASDSAFGLWFTDTTNYESGSSRLNWIGTLPASLHGLWVRHVLERYQGSSVHSDSVQLQTLRRQVALEPMNADTLLEQEVRTFRTENSTNYTQFLWTVSGGTPLNSVTDDSLSVRWDSLGVGVVAVQAWTGPNCSSTDSATVLVKGLGLSGTTKASISLWPNPSSGKVTVEFPPETAGLPFAVWDRNGRCLARGRVRDHALTLELAPGVYSLWVKGINTTNFTISSVL